MAQITNVSFQYNNIPSLNSTLSSGEMILSPLWLDSSTITALTNNQNTYRNGEMTLSMFTFSLIDAETFANIQNTYGNAEISNPSMTKKLDIRRFETVINNESFTLTE